MSNAVKLHSALLKTLGKIDVTVVQPEPVKKVSTGILSIDSVFAGGLPEGRFVEIFGEPNSGKSTSAMIIARQYQRMGKRVVLLDAENTFDPEYAAKFGMDVNALDDEGLPTFTIVRATTAEQWFDALREIIASRLYHLVIVDTLAAFVPRVEYESSIDKGTMGVFPRLFSRFARTVVPLMYQNPATVLLLNQVRLDIGNAGPYGAPKTSSGGNALKHLVSVILQTMKPQDLRDGDIVQGTIFRYKVVKSKVFTPDVKAVHELHIAIEPDQSAFEVDYPYELFIAGKRLGLITDKDGQPYEKLVGFFQGEKLGNGEKQILEFLDQPTELRDKLADAIYEHINQGSIPHANNEQGVADPGALEAVPDGPSGPGNEPQLWDLDD